MLETKTKPNEEIEKFIEYEKKNAMKATHCTNNKACQRPELLTIIIVIGILGSIVTTSSALNQIKNNPIELLALFIGVYGIVIFTGLYYGRYWAWIGIQALWAVKWSIYESEVISSELTIPAILIHTAAISLIVGLLCIYIYTKKVRKFCSI